MLFFLVTNFQIFLIVHAAVLLDTVVSVGQAVIGRAFNWRFFPDFLNKLLKYTAYLMFGNLVEYFSDLTGYAIDGLGLYLVASVLIAAEGASIRRSLVALTNHNKL